MDRSKKSSSFAQCRRAVKERPLLSLFLGSFLTTSSVPMTIFSLFIMASFTIGLISFVAVQGGVILFAGMILCAFLAVPFIISSLFALVVYGGMSAVNRFSSNRNIAARSPNTLRSGQYTGLTRMAHDMLTGRVDVPQFQGPLEREFESAPIDNVVHYTPIVIRPRPGQSHINPIANFINRHAGSPAANGTGLNFDFFASPSRTVEAHSASMNDARGNQITDDD